jgi:NAD(P)-dependent dehydrogenase (short-subunit alcohol dehydrogenase family)
MSRQIAGITAFVTGANRGIGRAVVDALLEKGAAKVYAASRHPEALADLVKSSGGKVVALELDVTDAAQIKAAAAQAGDVELLVNNAGVILNPIGGGLADSSWIELGRKEFEVNVFGLLGVTQAFAPILAKNGAKSGGSALINISSLAALVSFPILVTYSASKAAVHSLTQGLRALLKGQGTFVAGVYPGPIDTDMTKDLNAYEKTSPAIAAAAILAGFEAGDEEIFTDPMSQQLGGLYALSPKGLEQQIANG